MKVYILGTVHIDEINDQYAGRIRAYATLELAQKAAQRLKDGYVESLRRLCDAIEDGNLNDFRERKSWVTRPDVTITEIEVEE